MCQNPAVAQALARDRVTELHRIAGERPRSDTRPRPRGAIESARNTTGWLLIDMGLRLAIPRGAVSHPVARGSRSARAVG